MAVTFLLAGMPVAVRAAGAAAMNSITEGKE